MFGKSLTTSSAMKSSLPPQKTVEQVQNSNININQLLQSIPDQEQLASALSSAFLNLEAELKNYPSGNPIAKGSADLLKRVDREVKDLEKAVQACEILYQAVQKLQENQSAINADIEERKRVQTLLAVLQMDDNSNPQLDFIEKQMYTIIPQRQNIDSFHNYIKEQGVEIAKLIK